MSRAASTQPRAFFARPSRLTQCLLRPSSYPARCPAQSTCGPGSLGGQRETPGLSKAPRGGYGRGQVLRALIGGLGRRLAVNKRWLILSLHILHYT